MGKQVRLDDDVTAALERAADRAGRSVAAEANVRLRRQLGLDPGTSSGSSNAGWQGAASRVSAPSGIIGAGKGPAKATADRHRRARG